MDDLGQLIKDTRLRHGLSQERLARRAQTTQAVVSKIERGEVVPSMQTIRRLLAAMGWELDLRLRRSKWQDHDADALRAFGELEPEERLAGIESSARALSELAPDAPGHGDRDGA
jgi:transcriptional regulator with XRE-family HTH domain